MPNDLPVAGIPMKSPRCVPSMRLYAATRSPSATMCSLVKVRSGKARDERIEQALEPVATLRELGREVRIVIRAVRRDELVGRVDAVLVHHLVVETLEVPLVALRIHRTLLPRFSRPTPTDHVPGSRPRPRSRDEGGSDPSPC